MGAEDGEENCAENQHIFETGEHRRRMVITLVVVGPVDVQDEWGMKLGSFPGRHLRVSRG